MITSQGSLVLINAHTATPSVFWNGVVVSGITHIRIDWENDEQRVKLKVSAIDAVHDELRAAGITVKVEV